MDEVLGYRLVAGHYQPITPDDEGRILCDTVGLWLSLQNGRLVMEDAITGSRLQTPVELEALLARYRERFGELPDPNGGET